VCRIQRGKDIEPPQRLVTQLNLGDSEPAEVDRYALKRADHRRCHRLEHGVRGGSEHPDSQECYQFFLFLLAFLNIMYRNESIGCQKIYFWVAF